MPWGYVGGVQCDPIEKKPFFHAYPGALAYSFGMLGCDLHCGYCQNWVTSQALRDPAAVAPPLDATPEALVARRAAPRRARHRQHLQRAADHQRVGGRDLQGSAAPPGSMTGFVSNGNGTPQVLDYLRPWVDLYKVDLKSFDDRHYRELGGRLEPILDTIRRLHAMGFWVEIVTLLIPGFNDSRDELERLTAFVASVSPDIPWHVTAFHGDYKMTDPENTTADMLLSAADIARRNGLRYVYAGNLPGQVGDLENTRCHECRALLIERYGYFVRGYRITPDGTCPDCGTRIPGRWGATFDGQIRPSTAVPARDAPAAAYSSALRRVRRQSPP